MTVIKLQSKNKRNEHWVLLENVNFLSKGRDLTNDTWDISFRIDMGGHTEEYETEHERDARFEEVFAKWSGKTYLKEVK